MHACTWGEGEKAFECVCEACVHECVCVSLCICCWICGGAMPKRSTRNKRLRFATHHSHTYFHHLCYFIFAMHNYQCEALDPVRALQGHEPLHRHATGTGRKLQEPRTVLLLEVLINDLPKPLHHLVCIKHSVRARACVCACACVCARTHVSLSERTCVCKSV